jgi:DnaK suppressor protein
MKKALLAEMKTILEGERAHLLQEASRELSGTMSGPRENEPDPADLASNETDQSFTIRLRERERKLLAKIDRSLAKIAEGNYGVCEQCGEEIGEGRLKARPVTDLCIRCKTEQEEREMREKR